MNYFVLDDAGNPYGPADEALLRQWVQEGRIQPNTTIRDTTTGTAMLASAVPGLFVGGGPFGAPPASNPYSSPQPGGPVPGYAYHPRPLSGSNDVTVAWVMSIVGIVCAFCVCSLIGVGLGIGGVIFARRAAAAGDPRAQGPLMCSYASIGLGAVMLVVNILGFAAMRSGF